MEQSELLDELRKQPEAGRPSPPPRRGKRWLVIALVVVVVIVIGGIWLWPSSHAAHVQAVAVQAPDGGHDDVALQASGYIVARRKTTVSSQIIGVLKDVLFEEGDHVDKGQVLAHLKSDAQSAQLANARARVKSAQAHVSQTREDLQQAQRDRKRSEKLAAEGVLPQQKLEQARTKVASLQAQLRAKKRDVAAAKTRVDSAQVTYGYTTVRAPFSGIVTKKTAQAGETISPNSAGGGFTRTGVGTIVDMDSLEVAVDVNETDIRHVEKDMSADVVPDAYPDLSIPAHVTAVVPTADRSKGTVKVRLGLDARDEHIIPNMAVRVAFRSADDDTDSETAEVGVLVPTRSVVERHGDDVVFRVEDNTARAVKVSRVGEASQHRLRVSGDLAVGDRVVAKPADDLADGTRVDASSAS